MASMRGTVVGAAICLDLDDPSTPERRAIVADELDAEQAPGGGQDGPGQKPGQVRQRARPGLSGLRTRGRQPKKSRRLAGVIQANSARKAGMSVSRKMIAVWDGS